MNLSDLCDPYVKDMYSSLRNLDVTRAHLGPPKVGLIGPIIDRRP